SSFPALSQFALGPQELPKRVANREPRIANSDKSDRTPDRGPRIPDIINVMATSTITTYNNYIDGRWVPGVTGETFENRNPANTDDLIGVFQKSTRRDVEAAI